MSIAEMIKIEDFLPKYPNIVPFGEALLNPYSENFYKSIYRKREFYEKKLSPQESKPSRPGVPLKHQEIVSRFLSNHTLYDGLLLFHEMGTGKTGVSVAVSELIKSTLDSKDLDGTIARTLVLMKGRALIDNYINELVFTNTPGQYIPEDYDKFQSKEVKYRRIKNKVKEFYDFDTFEVFAKEIDKSSNENIIENYSNRLIVIDEVHNIRFSTEGGGVNLYKSFHRFLHLIKNSKILLMSATPMRDRPQEIASILNLILPLDKQLPTGEKFVREFMIRGDREDLYSLKESQIPKLKEYFKGRISYIKSQLSGVKKEFVGRRIGRLQKFIVKEIQMSDFQKEYYIQSYKKDTENKEEKGIYSNSSQASLFIFPDGKSGKDGFKSHITARELNERNIYELTNNFKEYLFKMGRDPDSILKQIEKCSAKYAFAIRSILDSDKSGRLSFIYCNFVGGSGAILFSKLLELFTFKIFRGDDDEELSPGKRYSIITNQTATTAQTRNILKVFNGANNRNGQYISVIIGSMVIGEGFSLKNVQDIHILTPYWNYSITDQAIARGLRLFSHNDLERDGIVPIVRIYQYVAVANNLDESIDYKMYLISEDKDISIKSVERVAKEAAFDCALNYQRNRVYNEDDMRSCDYQKCDYQCDGGQQSEELEDSELDYSTYDLYYNRNEIKDTITYIQKLFSVKNIYQLNEIISNKNKKFTLLKTLDKIIQERIPIINIHNQLCYLKQYRDTFYIDISVDTDSSPTEPYYMQNTVFFDLKTVDELVNRYELIRLPSTIKTLEETNTYETIFNNMTAEMVEFLIEAAVLGKFRNINKNIPLRDWILERYRAYIKSGDNYKYISTYLYQNSDRSQRKKIRCLTTDQKWVDCDLRIEDIENLQEKVKELGQFGYYGAYSSKDDKFRIFDVSDPTKVAGGAGKGKEKDTRLKSRGRVCKTVLKKDLVVMCVRLKMDHIIGGRDQIREQGELKHSEIKKIKEELGDSMSGEELGKLTTRDYDRAKYFSGIKTDELCSIIRQWFEGKGKMEYV